MKKVFLITAYYMGVLLIDEILKAGDKILGVVAWAGDYGYYTPEEYDVRTKSFNSYLPLYEPDPKKINNEEFLNVIEDLEPDYIISGYYPKLFSKKLLDIPREGCINFHPTGLPKFRGLSPYFTHMLFGDDRNYITMHWLDPGADTGDIIAKASVKILPEDTGFTCGHRLTEAGAKAFRKYWPLVKEGKAPREKQDESEATVFNFDWEMTRINWEKDADSIKNLIKSVSKPFDGASTSLGNQEIHIWNAEIEKNKEIPESVEPGTAVAINGKGIIVKCGKGALNITDLDIDGIEKSPLSFLSEFSERYEIKLGK